MPTPPRAARPPIQCMYAYGLDGATGEPLARPLPPRGAFDRALAAAAGPPAPVAAELKAKHDRQTRPDDALRPDRLPNELDQAGWGVIFGRGVADEVYDALRPLLDLRRRQAAHTRAHYFQVYRGNNAPAPGDSKQAFLLNNGLEVGMPADPEYMPYYLLLVGSPAEIPFKFQYELDVEYAVGRLWFPTTAEYRRYADAVVAADEGKTPVGRRAVLFAPWSPGDEPTRLSSETLVPPLATHLRADRPDWRIETVVGRDATRARLQGLLEAAPPAVLFTASHGLYFPPGHARHPADLGALVCADWPGVAGPIDPAWSFGAGDLPAAADLAGTVAVHFACFGAGTPRDTDYPHEIPVADGVLADPPVVAALPRALLGRGALAVVGHVDRAWATSFLTDRDQPQVQAFQGLLNQLLTGNRVGYAMEVLNLRFAALATQLTGLMTPLRNVIQPADTDVDRAAELWTGHNDARGYVVLGDPAVRLNPTP